MVCRVLIGLERARASGTLRLEGEGRSAAISLEASDVIAANVDRRVATSHRHVFEGMLQVCAWDRLVLRLVREPVQPAWWRLAEPLPARRLALDTMRAAACSIDPAGIRAELSDRVYYLTPAGERLLGGVALPPEEAAIVPSLRGGVTADQVAGCGLAGPRFVWMLKLLRAAAPKAGGSSYPLLLRKRREVRRHASAHALLDLPEDASGREARKALQKLVGKLHPDRFGEDAPAELRRASGEIVTALLEAESTIAMRAGR
jgi:hypothetical protein